MIWTSFSSQCTSAVECKQELFLELPLASVLSGPLLTAGISSPGSCFPGPQSHVTPGKTELLNLHHLGTSAVL